MNYILVGLTLLVLAFVIVSCVVLGSGRLAAAEYVSRDGLDAPDPERGPSESSASSGKCLGKDS